MNYEERVRHRELLERARELRERFEREDEAVRVSREEAAELAALVEEALRHTSPERFDRMMETIVQETVRRVGAGAPMR